MRSAEKHAQKPILSGLFFSVPISLICTHVMLWLTTPGHFMKLLLEKEYLIRLIPKVTLTLLLIVLIKLITRYLDVKMPWDKKKWSRLFLQIFYGVMAVVLIDLIFSKLYLELKGIRISETRYFSFYLTPIFIYILVLNWWYNYESLMPSKKISVAQEPEPTEEELLKKAKLEGIQAYCLKKRIVLIARSKKFPIAKNIDGECIEWNNSLKNSMPALPETDFFSVGRSHIVHRSIIAELKEQPEIQKLAIKLKAPFNDEIDIPGSRHVDFRNWWEADQGPEISSGPLMDQQA